MRARVRLYVYFMLPPFLLAQRSKSFIHYSAIFFIIPAVAYVARPFFMGKPIDEDTLKVLLAVRACISLFVWE